MYQFLKKQI
uniref:Uncharacterized protein n=1 Tax=Arundo donax TaxID=35708 RepID=A0A0A8YQI2_ARUDO